jgi:hypothetical protein
MVATHHLPRRRQRLEASPPLGHHFPVDFARAVVDPARADIDAVDAQTSVAEE